MTNNHPYSSDRKVTRHRPHSTGAQTHKVDHSKTHIAVGTQQQAMAMASCTMVWSFCRRENTARREAGAKVSILTNTDVSSNSTPGLLCDLECVTYLSQPVSSSVQ